MRWSRKRAYLIACATLAVLGALSLATFGLRHVARREAGLKAEYGPPGGPAVAVIDADLTTATVRTTSGRLGLRVFQARWTAFLHVNAAGWYSFRAAADGPFAAQVDTRPLVAVNHPEGGQRDATVWLGRGRHLVTAQYSHEDGSVECELWLARRGESRGPIAPAFLSTSPPSMLRARYAYALDLVAPYLAVAWTTFAVLCVVCGVLYFAVRSLRNQGIGRADLRAVALPLTVAAVLFAVGIEWGLPSYASWASDEISTPDLFVAMQSWFSNGWFSKYPPLQYYLLAVLNAPLFVASSVGLANANAMGPITFGLLTSRALTLSMALGTVLLVYLIAHREHGRLAGAAAAGILAVTLQFTYYAKTSNLDVPYTFWVVLSIVFYLRVWDRGLDRDSHWFAVAAALAVCTKDQAYGFYLLPGVAVVLRLAYLRMQQRPLRRVRGAASALATGLTSAAVALVVFGVAQNVVFNWTGFREHMGTVSGMGQAYTGMFPNTVNGHAQMLLMAVEQVGTSLGWPLFIFCLAGVALELRTNRRLRALWVLLPALSYYLFFVSVVRYHYDRFFIAVCAILAVYGGRAVAGLLQATAARGPAWGRWTRMAVAAAFAYSLIQCAALDQLMLLDSRYDAEQWIARHVKNSDLLAVAWPRFEYVPRLAGYRLVRIDTDEDLGYARPLFVVLNAEHATRFPENSPQRRLHSELRGGNAGYVLVYRYKAKPWGNPLAHFGTMSDERQDPLTNLDKINPTIEIYRKADAR